MSTFHQHIYLINDCLIGSHCFAAGDIVDLGSAERARQLANNQQGILVSDALSIAAHQPSGKDLDYLLAVVDYLKRLDTSESNSLADKIGKILPPKEKKIPLKKKTKGAA